MATPIILFNNSTGSGDTAASGAGPATPLSGTSANYSGTVVYLDGTPDLSGVATDGSHVLLLVADSGRHYFSISAVDDGADTVTVNETIAGTTTGLTWAIGGKKASIDTTESRLAFDDLIDGWVIELEYTGTNYTLSSTLIWDADSTSVASTLRGTGATRPIIEQTIAATAIDLNPGTGRQWSATIEFLKITNSHASAAIGIDLSRNMNLFVENCVLGDATDQLSWGVYSTYGANNRLDVIDSEILECAGGGINMQRGCRVHSSWIHDNASHGIDTGNGGGEATWVFNSLITNNGGDGINVLSAPGSPTLMLIGNVIDGNAGDGVDLAYGSAPMIVRDNIFSNNGGYGFNSSVLGVAKLFDHNHWYTNTSGDVNNTTKGANAGSGDPLFADAAANDYSLQDTSPCKGTGYPLSSRNIGADNSATKSYKDIGAAQRQEAAGATTTNIVVKHPRRGIF